MIGDYLRVNYGPPTRDYLCTSVDSSGMCAAPTTPMFPICFANGAWSNSSCISYDASTNTFDISPSNTGFTYTRIATGNISLTSGGIDPDLTVNPIGLYDGGNINLKSNVNITGLLLAGNYLNTTGDVTIEGLDSAGAYCDPDEGDDELGGSTTIDLNSATDDYSSSDSTLLGGGGFLQPLQWFLLPLCFGGVRCKAFMRCCAVPAVTGFSWAISHGFKLMTFRVMSRFNV